MMTNFFFQFTKQVDYGERELCADQPLLHVSEYLAYLSSDTPFFPNMNPDLLSDTSSANN
uniref:hypothetical protein n=1 Tax=Pantoea sp. IMH TaxID=1267600 RepID=UPI000468383A|nr:hypothetical protein [Pantoea sp. IMH]